MWTQTIFVLFKGQTETVNYINFLKKNTQRESEFDPARVQSNSDEFLRAST